MFKKYKQLFIGILIGVILATALPVGAVVQQYILIPTAATIVVDGLEFKDENLPIMAYNDYNYMPAALFRSICEKLGIGFKWDNDRKEIQIDTTVKATPTPEGSDNVSDAPLNKYGLPDFSNSAVENPSTKTEGNMVSFEFNDVKYISIGQMPNRPRLLSEEFIFNCPVIDGKVSYLLQFVKKDITTGAWTILIDEIPYARLGDRDFFIPYDYYINTILPLTKQ